MRHHLRHGGVLPQESQIPDTILVILNVFWMFDVCRSA